MNELIISHFSFCKKYLVHFPVTGHHVAYIAKRRTSSRMTEEPLLKNRSEQDSEAEEISFVPGLIEELPLSKLKPSSKPVRAYTEDMQHLAQSIREKGLLQPIVVRSKNDYFEVIAGNRRYSACKMLGWRKILCHIVELDDKEAYEISLVENVQRKTMDPIEEAEAYKMYILEFGWGSISELAIRIGKSPSYISKRISLLQLPSDIQAKIKSKEINPSAGEELLRLNDNEAQSELAQLISTRGISIRKMRQLMIESGKDCSRDSDEIELPSYSSIEGIERTRRAYDKAITSIRISLNKLTTIMEDVEDNWIVYEMLFQQKNVLHNQIDLLMKERRLLASRGLKLIL
jgi:ParB family chromosome partitioning protein